MKVLHFFAILFSSFLIISIKGDKRKEANSNSENGRIVGGFEVQDIIHYQAALVWTENDLVYCGGSIIAKNWIVTAAHCLTDESSQTTYARVGSLNYNSGGEKLEVKQMLIHPNFEQNSQDYDIALVEVKDITFNEKVYAIKLADVGKWPAAGSRALISGWGLTSYQGEYPERLRAAYLNIVDWNTCKAKYPDGLLTQRMICAYAPGKDSCQTDSGGPMVVDDVLVGVVSFGDRCGEVGIPGVYSNVADGDLRGFIAEKTGI